MRTDLAVRPGRVDVLGVGISAISLAGAVAEITRWIDDGEHHYVCVTNVHTVIECQRDEELRRIHNESGLTTPDGMPIVWCAKHAGAEGVTRVYGPDLMQALSESLAHRSVRSSCTGRRRERLELLTARLISDFPGLRIVGSVTRHPFGR